MNKNLSRVILLPPCTRSFRLIDTRIYLKTLKYFVKENLQMKLLDLVLHTIQTNATTLSVIKINFNVFK